MIVTGGAPLSGDILGRIEDARVYLIHPRVSWIHRRIPYTLGCLVDTAVSQTSRVSVKTPGRLPDTCSVLETPGCIDYSGHLTMYRRRRIVWESPSGVSHTSSVCHTHYMSEIRRGVSQTPLRRLAVTRGRASPRHLGRLRYVGVSSRHIGRLGDTRVYTIRPKCPLDNICL